MADEENVAEDTVADEKTRELFGWSGAGKGQCVEFWWGGELGKSHPTRWASISCDHASSSIIAVTVRKAAAVVCVVTWRPVLLSTGSSLIRQPRALEDHLLLWPQTRRDRCCRPHFRRRPSWRHRRTAPTAGDCRPVWSASTSR